jgi:hypothetical protein
MFESHLSLYPSLSVPDSLEEFGTQMKRIVSNYVGTTHTPEVIASLHLEIHSALRACFDARRIDTIPQIYITSDPYTNQVRVSTSRFVWQDLTSNPSTGA